jgi:short-subunit dehydrogenase
MLRAMSSPEYRTALVTGASSGIGAALARKLASEGIEVVLAARRTGALRELAKEIESSGGRAHVRPLDASDPVATAERIQAVDEEIGGLDIVVANAGRGEGKWGGNLTWDDCGPVIAVNVAGAAATLTAVLGRMVERGRGHLVGISSIAAYRGLPKFAAYSASKAFLSTFLESLRIDLRGTGVHVTDIRPGFVKTPMTKDNGRMPFLITADSAAASILKAIRAQRSVYAFPLPTAAAMRTATLLPGAVYDRVVGGRRRR